MQGVLIKPLKLVPSARGHLMEVQRRDDAEFPGFGQAYITQTFRGVVKAWYRHRLQTDQLAVAAGEVRLVLFDTRVDAPSRGQLLDILLGESTPLLVQIPPGIWHGFQATSERSAYVLHLNAQPFDMNAPDEERLASNDPSIPYRWRIL